MDIEINLFENYLYIIGILETINKQLLLNRIISIRWKYLKQFNYQQIICIRFEYLISYNSK